MPLVTGGGGVPAATYNNIHRKINKTKNRTHDGTITSDPPDHALRHIFCEIRLHHASLITTIPVNHVPSFGLKTAAGRFTGLLANKRQEKKRAVQPSESGKWILSELRSAKHQVERKPTKGQQKKQAEKRPKVPHFASPTISPNCIQ